MSIIKSFYLNNSLFINVFNKYKNTYKFNALWIAYQRDVKLIENNC